MVILYLVLLILIQSLLLFQLYPLGWFIFPMLILTIYFVFSLLCGSLSNSCILFKYECLYCFFTHPWFIDYGASFHVICIKDKFDSLKRWDQYTLVHITVGSSSSIGGNRIVISTSCSLLSNSQPVKSNNCPLIFFFLFIMSFGTFKLEW